MTKARTQVPSNPGRAWLPYPLSVFEFACTDVRGRLPLCVSHRSQNLVYAEEQRAKGNHICIVDNRGISALLRAAEAPCLRSRAVGSGLIELSLSAPREGEHDGGQDDGHRNDQQNRG